MEERKISGIIYSWSEIFNSKQVKVKLENDKDMYSFFGSPEQLNKLIDNHPVGAKIEFVQTQNGDFWNYKKATLKKLADAPIVPEGKKAPLPIHAESLRIIRQNAMSHATALMDVLQREGRFHAEGEDKVEEYFFGLAERCEKWVLR